MALKRRIGVESGDLRPGPFVAAAGIAVVAVVVLAWVILFLGGWKAVPVDKVGLHYSGGPLEGQHFEGSVSPGTRTKFYGLLESVYELPATQRTYIVSKHAGEGDRREADVIQAPSSEGVIFDFEAATYFKLNTDDAVVRKFFEQVCLKYHCTDLSVGGGWDQMLNDTLRQQLESAIQDQSRRFSTDDLANNPDALKAIQDAIAPEIKQRVNSVIGGNYFCGPGFDREHPGTCPDFTFIIKKVTAPESIRANYAAVKASQIAIEQARNDATKKRVEAEGEAAKQNALRAAQSLTPEQIDFVRAQAMATCAANTNCTLVISEGGGGQVNVNTGGATQR
jgi:hypothetical protein